MIAGTLCSFILCSISQSKTGGHHCHYHFNRITALILHCKIDDKMNEQSLFIFHKKYLQSICIFRTRSQACCAIVTTIWRSGLTEIKLHIKASPEFPIFHFHIHIVCLKNLTGPIKLFPVVVSQVLDTHMQL